MTRSDLSRYAMVSRRAALGGALGTALLAIAGCSSDDAALSGSPTGGASSTPSPSTVGSAAGSSASPSPTGSSGSADSAGSGKALPASAALLVSFTFEAAASSGRGPARNPYVAVWIESGGELVKTVALWHEDRGGQDRWLSEMRAFSALGAADVTTVSSATRQPGTYTVQWDGSTVQGDRAPAGTYQLFIEAAREHGPYELLQHDVALSSKAASFDLTPSGELVSANAKYTV